MGLSKLGRAPLLMKSASFVGGVPQFFYGCCLDKRGYVDFLLERSITFQTF